MKPNTFQPTLWPGHTFWHLKVLWRTSKLKNWPCIKFLFYLFYMSTLVTQVQTFPGYHSHHNPPQAERFERALRRYLTRKVSKINIGQEGEHYLIIKIRNYGTFLLHFPHFMNMIPFPLRLDLKLWWEYAAPGECHYTLSTVNIGKDLRLQNISKQIQ